MTIEPELLVLIEGERDAYRLIATWSRVGRDISPENLEQLERVLDAALEARAGGTVVEWAPASLLGRWARASGVDVEVVARWVPILFGSDMLGAGGSVDDSVRRLVAAAGVGLIGGRRR